VSDDSPQKGWDTWFGAEEDPSGGGQQVPEQQVPAPPPGSGPESENEQNNWTVPALGTGLSGEQPGQGQDAAAATQLVRWQPQDQAQQVEQQAEQQDRAEVREEQPQQAQVGPATQDAWQPQPAALSWGEDQPAAQVPPQGHDRQAQQEPRQQLAPRSHAKPAPVWNAAPADAAAATRQVLQQAQDEAQPVQQQPPQNPYTAAAMQQPTQAQQQAEQPSYGQPTEAWSAAPVEAASAAQDPTQADAQLTEVWSAAQRPTQADAQPTEVWSAAPAEAAAPAGQVPPRAQPAQMWGAAPVDAAPTTLLPPQAQAQAQSAQPPQNPYAAAMQQQPNPGYGQAPTQAPGANEQTGWDGGPQPPRATAFPAGAGDEPRPRSRRKVLLSSGIGAVAIVGLATVLVMNQSSLTGSAHPLATQTPSGFQPTGTTVAGDAEQTASAFLSAWENGNFKQAAAYTDDPTAAQAALTSYESGLNLNGLQLSATGSTAIAASANPSTAASGSSSAAASTSASASAGASAPSSTAGVVTFNVVAKVGLPASSTTSSTSSASASAGASTSASASASSAASSGASSSSTSTAVSSTVTADWSYASKLTAYKKDGGWWIQWAPSLVAPNLTASEKLVSVAIAPSASKVTDASGNDLSTATDAGVHNIYLALKKSAPSGEGTPGVEIELETASGTPITSSADVLSQPVNTGVVKTTISPTVEAAAQSAVTAYPESSMVVLQPSTGDILAVANNDGGNDFALTARIAPGSTNKIITSTALLASGLVSSPSQAVECKKSITVDGTVFANSQGESEPASTPFLNDFAVSCNNAFGGWYNTIGSTTLADTAEKYYGLNQQWNLGVGEAGPYYSIPSSASNGELFQELFGQGELEAAPLAMASVGATVDTGTFKQPILVPGTTQLTATPLPSNVQQDLYEMMKAVVYNADGTAYNVFSGVNSTVYGKTGTADVGSTQDKPNSWMVVFDPTLDVAVACVVLDAGYGASFAGPEAATVLKDLQ